MIASTFSGIHDFIHSGTWQVIRNLLFFFLIAFWLAVGYWSTRTRSGASRTRC